MTAVYLRLALHHLRRGDMGGLVLALWSAAMAAV